MLCPWLRCAFGTVERPHADGVVFRDDYSLRSFLNPLLIRDFLPTPLIYVDALDTQCGNPAQLGVCPRYMHAVEHVLLPSTASIRIIAMAINRRLLAIIGRRLPAIYDVIPRGPQGRFLQNRFSEVALNPQPLPPQELGAAIAAEFIHAAWLADRFGLDQGIAFNDLDDWCPTRPKKLKLPPWWPPIPEPDPQPDWFIHFHLGFAARLAVASVDSQNTRLGESFDKAVDRSIEAIEAANL